jgi:LCP family protein required for cell wall assembly
MKEKIRFVFGLMIVIGLCLLLTTIFYGWPYTPEPKPTPTLTKESVDHHATAKIKATENQIAFETRVWATPTITPTPTVTPTPEPERYVGALLGTDWEPGRPQRNIYGVRTDVNIIYIAEVPWEEGLITIHLFNPSRDLFGWVPCSETYDGTEWEGRDRINAAYTYGGLECVEDTIEATFGLEVNAPIALIDLFGYVDLIDKIGGIDIMPTRSYSEWCGYLTGNQKEYKYWYEGRTYHMDGLEALCYVRGRTSELGDLDRNRKAIDSLFAIYQALDITDAYKLWSTYHEYVESNVQVNDVALAFIFAKRDHIFQSITLSLDEVEFFTTPTGASVLLPKVDLAEWLKERLE